MAKSIKKNRVAHVQSTINKVTRQGLEQATITIHGRATDLSPYDTGNLRGSIDRKVTDFEGSVGTNVHYAPHQEYGTYKMDGKPFLMPALLLSKGDVKEQLLRAYRAAVKEAIR